MTSEIALPLTWERTGLVMSRSSSGDGSEVVGDPCVVWDPEIDAWRMVLFFNPPGHATAVSYHPTAAPGTWTEPERLRFTNPGALPHGGGTQKPYIVMDAHRPNAAAFVDGRYWLLTVSFTGEARDKRVQRAWASSLAGPWTLEDEELIPRGARGEFDENHVDAVSGFWFDELQMFLYFYMGYPVEPQAWGHSPYGNAIGVATQRLGERAIKAGVAIKPSEIPDHWASGYLGGLQLLPGVHHRWIAVLNASPTKPDRSGALTSEEPAPSLGGLAYTDADVPTQGWVLAEEPFEWIDHIPDVAIANGEGVNLWRQHVIVTTDETRLFYNTGTYGTEQLYSKRLVGKPLG